MKHLRTPLLLLASLCIAFAARAQVGFTGYVPVNIRQTAEAVFPRQLIPLGIKTGVASVAIAVDDKGQLTDYLVTAYSHPAFADASVSALKKWKFDPAMIHGNPRNSKADITFNFAVEGVVVVSVSSLSDSEIIKYRLAPLSQAYAACTLSQLDRIPTPTKIVNPSYTGRLARSSRGGNVSVQFYIDEQGHVRMPSVSEDTIESNEELSAVAIEAVGKWQFDPPLSKGRPVLVLAQQDFTFKAVPQ
jgi:TonB family protein